MTDTTIETGSETTGIGSLTVWLAFAGSACAGVFAGLVAQLMRQDAEAFSGALADLGRSTAVWLTIGFLIAHRCARAWPAHDRIAWVGVVAATYLFGWLIAYHTLFGIREHLDFAQVWPQMRFWIAAVAPACAALGLVAVSSLRKDWLGDACLILPLGWSLHDAYVYGRQSASGIAIVAVPTLLAALVLPITARNRKWRPLVAAVTLLVSGVAFYFLFARFTLDSSS